MNAVGRRCSCQRDEEDSKAERMRTGPRFGVPQEVLPQIVVVLLLSELDRAVHVPEPVDDEVERLLVVPHPSEQENHLEHEVTLVADIVRLYAPRSASITRSFGQVLTSSRL